jgi:hypothetical protein
MPPVSKDIYFFTTFKLLTFKNLTLYEEGFGEYPTILPYPSKR